MTAPAPIREIEVPTPAAFRDEIVGSYTPVVIRGLVRDWPVVTAALQSTEAVAEHLLRFDRGAAAEAFVGPPEIGGRFFYSPDMTGFNFERRRGGFGELLRYLLGIVGKEGAPSVYAGALETAEMLPGFAEANPCPCSPSTTRRRGSGSAIARSSPAISMSRTMWLAWSPGSDASRCFRPIRSTISMSARSTAR
ncbi:cupin-like domain-containing protein [Sphingomonas sp. 7/4-4]|uniref:cupin-like domain-containing protein n=1 Tax=Sphingomonas sp. 7/4-4 TaxID=3018446 RepID=UPI0022F38669|nr:cupin-like domain-containing protein [Sphingomonas sp. 7/4-4]WBY09502.1 cupin-like domain-containing protein [Sphingomonas sp. 7/4-4]